MPIRRPNRTRHLATVEKTADALRAKADRIESAAREVVRLARAGAGEAEIVSRVFPNGRLTDLAFAVLTRGEFSRRNFVRKCGLHVPDRPA